MEARLQRITDDLGDLKGHVAGRIAREMSDDIAEHLGYEITQQLNGNDLRNMLRGSTANDVPAGVRRLPSGTASRYGRAIARPQTRVPGAGIEPARPFGQRILRTTIAFATAPAEPAAFVVWTIPLPYAPRALRQEPSSLYTFPRAAEAARGLARDYQQSCC